MRKRNKHYSNSYSLLEGPVGYSGMYFQDADSKNNSKREREQDSGSYILLAG